MESEQRGELDDGGQSEERGGEEGEEAQVRVRRRRAEDDVLRMRCIVWCTRCYWCFGMEWGGKSGCCTEDIPRVDYVACVWRV